MHLKDRVIVITGGSQGLGRTLALRLAREGTQIWIIAQDESNLREVVTEIRSSGGHADFFVADVRSRSTMKLCVEHILERHARIDVLINNAGIWLQGQTHEASPEKVREVFETNIIGMIYTTQVVLPSMRINGAGHIINVGSTASVEPSGEWGIYAASKYGVRGFTDSLKKELEGSGIKVTGFYPGGMGTNLYKNARLSYSTKEPWMMVTEDVAEIVVHVLTRPDDVVIDHIEVRKIIR
jgi:NADP-dependent 3-hydroxy acid dehydrogenase YdfG